MAKTEKTSHRYSMILGAVILLWSIAGGIVSCSLQLFG